MGKQDAQRIKGNAKPSSSFKAAEMLQQVTPNLANLTLSQIGASNLLEDSLDSVIDPEMRMVLRKLSKKDNLTKTKSLEELKGLIENRSNDDCVAIVPYWSKIYTKLTIENDRKIRELCQQVHEKICSKVKKNIAPHLKLIVPYWLLAQSDSASAVARIAESAFKSTFNENKQPEVIYFACDEIIDVIHDFLIVETANTLSDIKTTCQDEANQKYENVICMSLQALSLFFKYYLPYAGSKSEKSIQKLEKIFDDPKFWKLSKNQSSKIRIEFYSLLTFLLSSLIFDSSVVAKEPLLIKLADTLKRKIIPLVFYACDEENTQCASLIWSSIRRCLSVDEQHHPDILSLVNVKKAFIPKLVAFLKSLSSSCCSDMQSVEMVFASLSLLIPRLGREFDAEKSLDERLAFYQNILDVLLDGVLKQQQQQVQIKANIEALINIKVFGFFESFCAAFDQLVTDESIHESTTPQIFDFLSKIVQDNVFKLFQWYLSSKGESSQKFEIEFKKFLTTISASNKTTTRIDLKRRLEANIWTQTIELIKNNLSSSNNLSELVVLKICRLFCGSLHSAELNEPVRRIACEVFNHVLAELHERVGGGGDGVDSKLTGRSLRSLNNLVSYFVLSNQDCAADQQILKSFLTSIAKREHADDLPESVNHFNDVFTVDLIKQSPSNFEIVFQVILLYLRVNMAMENSKHDVWVAKLDRYVFELASVGQPSGFLVEYFEWLKSDCFDSQIDKLIVKWISSSSQLDSFISSKLSNLPVDQFVVEEVEFAFDLIDHDLLTNQSFVRLITCKNQEFLNYALSNRAGVESGELKKFLKHNVKLVRKLSVEANSDYMWSQLIQLVKLGLQESTSRSAVRELCETLMRAFVSNQEKIESIGLSRELSEMLMKEPDVVRVLNELLKLIKSSLSGKSTTSHQEWIVNFLINTMNKSCDMVSFRQVFESILFEQNSSKDKLIRRRFLMEIFLSQRLNYLYTEQQKTLLVSSDLVQHDDYEKKQQQLPFLDRLNYTLTLLGIYLKHANLQADNNESLILSPSTASILFSNANWFYLFSSALVVEQFYRIDGDLSSSPTADQHSTTRLINSIRAEFQNIFYSNDAIFFTKLLNVLIESNQFELLLDQFSLLEFNHLSYFLTRFVDMAMLRFAECSRLLQTLNQFSQRLIEYSINPRSQTVVVVGAEIIRFYLYDLSFAKHSVLGNLDNLRQNINHYYSLFGSLIDSKADQLCSLLSELYELVVVVDTTASSIVDVVAAKLSEFNLILDLFTKYLSFYFSMLQNNNTESSQFGTKLFDIFCCSPETLEFIEHKVSKNMNRVIDMLAKLKTANKNKSCSRVLFFLEPNASLEWTTSVAMIDKLNTFLGLLFVDYRLNVAPSTSCSHSTLQMSKYLDSNHWDFLMCYTSECVELLDPKRNINFYLLIPSLADLVNLIATCMDRHVFTNTTTTTTTTTTAVHSEWIGFFAKEIFDKLLLYYVNIVEQDENSSSSSSSSKIIFNEFAALRSLVIERLGNACASISFERLLHNELELRLNVLDDFDLGGGDKMPVIFLPDKLKSLFNYLMPMLRDNRACVQWNSYRILRTVMAQMSRFYEIKPIQKTLSSAVEQDYDDEQDDESGGGGGGKRYLTILESLPSVFRETLAELGQLFGNVKNIIPFDESVLVDLVDHHELSADSETSEVTTSTACSQQQQQQQQQQKQTNNKLVSFLLVNKLVLDMLSSSSSSSFFEFKVKLGSDLRRTLFIDNIMHVLFRTMPETARLVAHKVVDIFKTSGELDTEHLARFKSYPLWFENDALERIACVFYKSTLQLVPAIVRDWWNIQTKRIADQVEKFTIKYVSPILIEEEVKLVNQLTKLVVSEAASSKSTSATKTSPKSPPSSKYDYLLLDDDDEQSSIKIRGILSTREIVSIYKMKELSMELIVELPVNYPLGVVKVSSAKRIGVSENEWRNWMLQLTNYLTHQNGSIYQGIQIWKQNVDKKFAGVEECTICYSVIHGTNFQLPKMKCRTCKKKFHSVCLYKWFESSSKSTCPLCRNIF